MVQKGRRAAAAPGHDAIARLYRGTSLIRNRTPLEGHHRALGKILMQGKRPPLHSARHA